MISFIAGLDLIRASSITYAILHNYAMIKVDS